MKLILCLDDHGGMAFAGRRQSMDRVLRTDMLALAQENSAKIWMSSYSASQFDTALHEEIFITDGSMDDVPDGDYFFAELTAPSADDIGHTDELVIYWWNRLYPSDVSLDIVCGQTSFTADGTDWELISAEDFVGYSHEKITRSIFRCSMRKE